MNVDEITKGTFVLSEAVTDAEKELLVLLREVVRKNAKIRVFGYGGTADDLERVTLEIIEA